METTLLFVFAGFLLVNLLFGAFSKRNRWVFGDVLANRSFSTGTLLLTLTATVIGSFYVTTVFRLASAVNLISLIAIVVGVCGSALFLLYFVFFKLHAYKGCYTLGDIVGREYGKYAQLATGIVSTLFSVVFLVVQFLAVEKLTTLLGIPGYWIIIIMGVTVTAYTAVGGIRTVAYTDILQLALVLAGLSWIAYAMLNVSVENVSMQGLADLWSKSKERLADLGRLTGFESIRKDPALLRQMHSTLFLGMLFLSPPIIHRVLMARDKNQLRDSFLGLVAIILMLMFLLLISGLGLFLVHNRQLYDQDVFLAISKVLSDSVWVRCLLLLMLLSAVTSTADSILNSAVVVVRQDVIKVWMDLRGRVGEVKKIDTKSYWVPLITIILGFASVGLTLFYSFKMATNLNFLDTVFNYSQLLLGILFLPLLGIGLGIRKNQKALLGGMAFYVVALVGSVVLAKYGDFSFMDANWKALMYGKWQYKLPLYRRCVALFPYTMLLSCLVYLLLEWIVNKGWRWEARVQFAKNKQPSALQLGWREARAFVDNPLAWSEEKLDKYGSRPVALALFCILIFLMPSFVGRPVDAVYAKSMTVLMLSVLGLCTCLFIHDLWYRLPKIYYGLFWLGIATYCLPFSFLLRVFYQPSGLNALYLVLVPLVMHFLLGRNLGISLSVIGYGVAWLVWVITRQVEIGLDVDFLWRVLGALVLVTWVIYGFGGYHAENNWEKFRRSNMLAGTWAHDLSHLFMEAQMGLDDRYNPLPKEAERRLKEREKRMKATLKVLQAGVQQSQAFRQLMVQHNTRPSEIVSMPLNEVVKYVYEALPVHFQEMVDKSGVDKVADKVRIFLPIFTSVVTNLIRNAYKAGATKVVLNWDEKACVLYVKDDGPGIPKEKVANLFEAVPKREGSGMGLPFIRYALGQMGALIDVDLDSGKGTSLMILLELGD